LAKKEENCGYNIVPRLGEFLPIGSLHLAVFLNADVSTTFWYTFFRGTDYV
jgi:hypothetical protein